LLQKLEKHQEAIEAFDQVIMKNPLDFTAIAQKQISLQKVQNAAGTQGTAGTGTGFFANNIFGSHLPNMFVQVIPQVPKKGINKSDLLLEANLPLESHPAFINTPPKSTNEAQKFYFEGLNFQSQFNHAKALESFNKAIALDPNYVSAHHLKAVSLIALNQIEEGLQALEEAIQLKSDIDSLHLAKALQLQKLGREPEAIESFDKVLSLGLDDINIHFEKANCLVKLERFDEALESLNKVLLKAPECLEVLKKKGSILQDLGKHEEAVGVFDQVVALMPKSSWTSSEYYQKALSLQSLGRNLEAIECLKKALELTPGNNVYLSRLYQLLSLKEKAKANEQDD